MSVHLFHGLFSMFQSMGASPNLLPIQTRRRLAVSLSAAIGLGYASMPIAVLTGILDHATVG